MLIVRFCEYASVQEDGSFMVVRGGLKRWEPKDLPAQLPLWVLVEMESFPKGCHDLGLRLAGPTGEIWSALDEVQIESVEATGLRIMQVPALIAEPGWYVLEATSGGDRGTARLEVEPERQRQRPHVTPQVPSINLSEFEIDPEVLNLVPAELARRHKVLAINRTLSTLIIVMADPRNLAAIDELKSLTGLGIEVVGASEQDIHQAIQRYYA